MGHIEDARRRRAHRSWAASGPSEAAQSWPMSTNDNHQAHEPTAPEQQKTHVAKIPGNTQGKKK